MRPAFSSTRQAVAFALLIAVLLALPAVVARTGLLEPSDVYPSIAWKYGPFPYIQQKVFAETGDVDMVFAGSSHLWTAIDTPYVQRRLSERLGREAEVFSLGWPWPGYDALYTMASDLLERRRVHTLVIYDEETIGDLPHPNASRWVRIDGDSDALEGLPLLAQARLYGSAVLGTPRRLLALVRPNLLEDPARCRPNYWNDRFGAPNVANQRGALKARLGFVHDPIFVPFRPRTPAARPEDARIYSAARGAFAFTGRAVEEYQLHFARKLARLCRDRGTQLVILHPPVLTERDRDVIAERQCWPELLGAPAEIVGIPPAKLFAGIDAADVPKLFFDDFHLNQNGQELFTPLITPTLVSLYDRTTTLARNR